MKTNYVKPVLFILFAICLQLTVIAVPKKTVKKSSSPRASKLSRTALANTKVKNVQFGFNQADFESQNKKNLNQVAKLMIDNNAGLKLGGYTDSKGDYVYNWKLSKKRVDAVKTYLVGKGADSSRIAATEYGETKPIASNATSSGRKRNRRVEVQFIN